MIYSKSYIELQYKFAKLLEQNFDLNIIEAVYEYTNIYLSLTLDFSFNKENKIWRDFVDSFKDSSDYIYSKYLEVQSNSERRDVKKSEPFGCFSYHYEEDSKTIRLHFANNDTSGFGPLSKERIQVRKEELTKMFDEIKEKHKNAKYVKGKSWLYSLESYKRLFPEDFVKSLKEFDGKEWQFMTLWGQFLDSEGNIKEELANKFLDCAKTKKEIDEILNCFPFKIYVGQVEINKFFS